MFFARKLLRDRARQVFVKEYEPKTGGSYYRNLRTGTRLSHKPQCFGSEDLDFIDRWYLLSDPSGKTYYYNPRQIVQSWDVPSTCLTCGQCDRFAAWYSPQENVVYCASCWERWKGQHSHFGDDASPLDGALTAATTLLGHLQTQWGYVV